jgi:hypothetical protein
MPDLKRLAAAVEWSYRTGLAPFRRRYMEALRQFVGSNYSDQSCDISVPINGTELLLSTYRRQLTPSEPRAMATTWDLGLEGTKNDLEAIINQDVKDIHLDETLGDVILDGLFSLGIAKCGQEYKANGSKRIFVEPVCVSDWVHDCSVKRIEDAGFMGNQYVIPFDSLQDGSYDPEVVRLLSPSESRNYSGSFNLFDDDERPEDLSHGERMEQGAEYRDMIRLWDLWLPEEGILLTVPHDHMTRPLKVQQWQGPPEGPYLLLNFNKVPGNVMPLSLVSLVFDLDLLNNQLFNKLADQAVAQKTIGLAQGTAEADSKAILEAKDGTYLTVDNPGATREVRMGGIDNQTLAFHMHVSDQFGYYAGNLDALGGLAPQSGTLGQDEILNQNASKRLADMQDRVRKLLGGILRTIAWYRWHEFDETLRATRTIAGIQVPFTWKPGERRGTFDDYRIEVNPYSMAPKTPQGQLRKLVEIFQTFVAPYAAQIESQGVAIDFAELLREVGKLSDWPGLGRFIRFGSEPRESKGSGRTVASPVSHRVNERISRSATPTGEREDRKRRVMQNVFDSAMQGAQTNAA